MSTDSLIQLLTQALFVLVFIVSAARLIRRPRRVDGDIALFFGAAAVLLADHGAALPATAAGGRLLRCSDAVAARGGGWTGASRRRALPGGSAAPARADAAVR